MIGFLRSFGSIGAKADGFKYTGTDGRRGYEVEPGAGMEGGTTAPPYALSDVFASGVGNYFSFEFGWDQAMMMFQPVGGMDRIPYAFAKAIGPEKFVYGAKVLGLRNTSTGVEVTYSTGSRPKVLTADYAICALPPHIAATVPSNLPTEIIAALQYARPTNAGKLGIEYGRRWWELDHRIYGGITNSNLDTVNMWYPSTGFHGERGTVIGYYNTGANATAYGALSPAARLERALAQGTKIHGNVYSKDVKASFSVDWMGTEHSLVSPSPRHKASTYSDASARTSKPPGSRTPTSTRCGSSSRTQREQPPWTSPAGTVPTASTSPTPTSPPASTSRSPWAPPRPRSPS